LDATASAAAFIGAVLAAAALAACTSQPGKQASGPASRPVVSSRVAAADLTISGQRGYGATAYATPDFAARIVYTDASSCRSSRSASLRMAVRWRYKGQTLHLTAMHVTFNEESMSLALPFVAIELTGVAPAKRWVTSAIQSANAQGDHTTGWVDLTLNTRMLSPNSHPVLSAQLWAESAATGKIYCADSSTLTIPPGSPVS
jgi:hypothetical protein